MLEPNSYYAVAKSTQRLASNSLTITGISGMRVVSIKAAAVSSVSGVHSSPGGSGNATDCSPPTTPIRSSPQGELPVSRGLVVSLAMRLLSVVPSFLTSHCVKWRSQYPSRNLM